MSVALRSITRDNVSEILKLEVSEDQRRFVATNAISLAQAYVYGEQAWPRAIYDDDTPVGFAMLALEPGKPPWIWRFLIAASAQRRGLGRDAMALLIQAARALRPEATELRLSYVPGPGDPSGFYAKLGFEETGELEEDERVMRLRLG